MIYVLIYDMIYVLCIVEHFDGITVWAQVAATCMVWEAMA